MTLHRRGLLVLPCLGLQPGRGAATSVARTYLIYFDHGSANLDSRGRDAAVAAAKQYHRFAQAISRLEVSGHTSLLEASAEKGHLALGLARARNVSTDLANAGVPLDKVIVQSFGEARPIAPCDDDACHLQNRRVEIFLR